MAERPPGRVLVIAGSDSSGGAGLQADVKTVTALGGYAATAVTAVTVQDTRGVHAIHAVPAAVVTAQAEAVLGDIGADVIKIGMLGSAEVAGAVANLLDRWSAVPVVLDPVMTAKGGAALLDDGARAGLRRLIARCALLTPNAPEAADLAGFGVATPDDLRRAGRALQAAGAAAVLMKGGHLDGPHLVDLLITPAGETPFAHDRIDTRHTHGTGCTLASACAVGLAQGMTLEAAVARACAYVQGAIRTAPGLGRGAGPLNHGWTTDGTGARIPSGADGGGGGLD